MAGIVLALLAGACEQIFGLEDARLDPTLTSSGATGAGGGGSDTGGGGTATENGGSSSTGAGPAVGGSNTGGAGNGGASGSAQGGTNNGGTNTEPTAGEGGSGDDPAPLCERYCEAVLSNCEGSYEQYRNLEQCMGTCTRLPAGSPGDRDVNTIECRMRQVEFAEAEPFVYCKSSGPLGAGECGSNCVSYCALMMATCTPETTAGVVEPAYFESNESCLATCSAITPGDDAPTEYTTSAEADPVCFMGNHVYCRAYHVASAIAEAAPDEHCPHSMGADPCIDP